MFSVLFANSLVPGLDVEFVNVWEHQRVRTFEADYLRGVSCRRFGVERQSGEQLILHLERRFLFPPVVEALRHGQGEDLRRDL